MKQKAEELTKVYENMDEEAKKSMSKLEALIEKNAMTPDQVDLMVENALRASDGNYPELEKVEGMTSEEYAAMYKKMAEEAKSEPEKFEGHVRASGMSADELAVLFAQIGGAVEKYPEIWESQEAAQMLHPKNMAILVNVFKKEE